MAITGATLSYYDEVLKTFYLPAIQEYLEHSTPLSDILERDTENVSGKNATIECHYGRSTGTGARADAAALPTPGYQKYKTCTVPMKYVYGRVEFTGPTLAATRDERGAYIGALDSEIRGIARDLKKEVNRMLWGSGYGVLARWRSTEDTTEYTLQKKYRGNSAGGDAFGSTFGGKYLRDRGDAVPVVATAGSAGDFTVDDTNIAVTAVIPSDDNTYDTITCTDPSVTEAAATFYVRPASLGTKAVSGGHRLEPMGLRGIVDVLDIDDIAISDGTDTGLHATYNDPLQGLDVATYPWFKGIVDAHPSGRYAGQRALSLKLMQKMFDRVEDAAGKDTGPNLIQTTRALRAEYLELLQATRQNVNTMELDGGWKALDYNGVPLMVDSDAIDGEIYFLTTGSMAIFEMSGYDWMQKDGAILSRISGYDAYEAILYKYFELGVKRRHVNGVLCDLAYDEDYAV